MRHGADHAGQRGRLDAAITAMAAIEPWASVVTRLGYVQGIATLTAFELAAEIGDRQRITGASTGHYPGLARAEDPSGDRRAQVLISKRPATPMPAADPGHSAAT